MLKLNEDSTAERGLLGIAPLREDKRERGAQELTHRNSSNIVKRNKECNQIIPLISLTI